MGLKGGMEAVRRVAGMKPLEKAAWIFCIATCAVFVYLFVLLHTVEKRFEELSGNLAAMADSFAVETGLLGEEVSLLKDKTEGLSSTLSNTENILESTKRSVENVASKVGGVEVQVGSISGTVSTLEKLSKTDPELLQKYSKVFFLNENYAPSRVVEILPPYLYRENEPEVIHASVWPYLEKLLAESVAAGKELFVRSAYRSFDEQKSLKSNYSVTYGAGTANQFSADQGYSEHQLGTAVDFITTGLSGELSGFDRTDEYEWLLANAYRYGFILSYPKANSYYVFEPWHWRFVGIALATKLRDENKYFYDLEQREIDEHLADIFE